MLAWAAAFLFAFAAVSGAANVTPASPWPSWQVLACAGMVLLALDQALVRRCKDSSDEERKPR